MENNFRNLTLLLAGGISMGQPKDLFKLMLKDFLLLGANWALQEEISQNTSSSLGSNSVLRDEQVNPFYSSEVSRHDDQFPIHNRSEPLSQLKQVSI